MRLVIQRVLRASLTANEQLVSQIDRGMMVLCGITHDDNVVDIDYLVPKLLKTRIWQNEQGQGWATNVVENDF